MRPLKFVFFFFKLSDAYCMALFISDIRCLPITTGFIQLLKITCRITNISLIKSNLVQSYTL